MLATNTERIPKLNPNKKYIFLLEHLEPAMEIEQLDYIITRHNEGIDYKKIAKEVKRHPAEVLVALIHQACTYNIPQLKYNRGNVEITRPLAKRLIGKGDDENDRLL